MTLASAVPEIFQGCEIIECVTCSAIFNAPQSLKGPQAIEFEKICRWLKVVFNAAIAIKSCYTVNYTLSGYVWTCREVRQHESEESSSIHWLTLFNLGVSQSNQIFICWTASVNNILYASYALSGSSLFQPCNWTLYILLICKRYSILLFCRSFLVLLFEMIVTRPTV